MLPFNLTGDMMVSCFRVFRKINMNMYAQKYNYAQHILKKSMYICTSNQCPLSSPSILPTQCLSDYLTNLCTSGLIWFLCRWELMGFSGMLQMLSCDGEALLCVDLAPFMSMLISLVPGHHCQWQTCSLLLRAAWKSHQSHESHISHIKVAPVVCW